MGSSVLVRAVRRRRRRADRLPVLVAVGAVVGLSLVGCSQPAQQAPTPTAEASASPAEPSPTPTPEPTPEPVTEPVPPPEMERGDEAGAIAAAEYFMRLSEYAFLTGDLSTWNEISTTDCGYCRNVSEAVSDVYGSGGYYTGGALELTGGAVNAFDSEISVYAIVFTYAAADASAHDSDGAVVETVPAGGGAFLIEVIPTDTGWRLIEAGTTEQVP